MWAHFFNIDFADIRAFTFKYISNILNFIEINCIEFMVLTLYPLTVLIKPLFYFSLFNLYKMRGMELLIDMFGFRTFKSAKASENCFVVILRKSNLKSRFTFHCSFEGK